jgi:predicted alpha/beta-hydrolase family hydrolase
MSTKSITIKVSPEIGSVSGELVAPAKPQFIMTLAHGAGAGMDHVFMKTLSEKLAEAGIATLRFNFPFTEHGKGRPDTPAVAHQTIAAAIGKAHKLYPDLPLYAAGKSFGGRMSSQYLAANPGPEVKGLVFYGFPLHPSGKPGIDRAEHLKSVKVRMLFIQGTKDTLATWDLITGVCDSLSRATLVKIDAADHSFKAGKRDTMTEIVDATRHWIR